MEITLDQLLAARDRRRERQFDLLTAWPGCALTVATVVMPGAVKRDHRSAVVATAVVAALDRAYAGHIQEHFSLDLPTGFEAWYLTDLTDREAKRLAVDIEDTHPLGRLMDIDVISRETRCPVSRTEEGHNPRRCLICNEDARVCMRLGSHTQAELSAHIDNLIADYERSL